MKRRRSYQTLPEMRTLPKNLEHQQQTARIQPERIHASSKESGIEKTNKHTNRQLTAAVAAVAINCPRLWTKDNWTTETRETRETIEKKWNTAGWPLNPEQRRGTERHDDHRHTSTSYH